MPPRAILFAAWLVAIAYSFPGYMNWDACSQLTQARAGQYGDGHPPVMALYWRWIDFFVHGPFGMLVLQTSLFLWGLYQIFKLRFTPRAAAVIASALFLFPPVLTPMTTVWKDAQMAGFLIAGLALALRPSWRARAGGLALLFLGTAVRHNAPVALPALCLLIAAAWSVRGKLRTIGVALGLTLALTGIASVANSSLGTREYWWARTQGVHDIMGTICFSPAMTDDQVRTLLVGVPLLVDKDLQRNMCKRYNPRAWFSASFGEGRVFGQTPDAKEIAARREAWKRIVFGHPAAYLKHRWLVMREVLGLSDSPIWEPVCEEFGGNHEQAIELAVVHTQSRLQVRIGRLFVWCGTTVIFRPWAYLVVALILFGYALKKRDGWVLALIASGVLYEASYFVGAPSPDFRYSHWLVTCT
ncbi:MAG TPA: hypothetical protein VIV58_13830, partial [Kofleriaceae bacterium]